MTDTEKLVLEKLDTMSQKMESMDQRMNSVSQKMESVDQRMNSISQKMEFMEQKMDSMDQKMNEGFKTTNNRIDKLDLKVDKGFKTVYERINQLDQKTDNTNVIMETEISRKIDVIGEGHDFLNQRLDSASQMEKKREHMELELINLRMDVKKIKEHLNIA